MHTHAYIYIYIYRIACHSIHQLDAEPHFNRHPPPTRVATPGPPGQMTNTPTAICKSNMSGGHLEFKHTLPWWSILLTVIHTHPGPNPLCPNAMHPFPHPPIHTPIHLLHRIQVFPIM